jgi:hypothetical protein
MLRIYTAPDVDAYLDNNDVRALVLGHNRKNVVPNVRRLYLRNTDPTLWLSNVYISATSSQGDFYSGANGFGVKFYYGQLEPTERVWSHIPYNQPIYISTIGQFAQEDTSFKMFWLRSDVVYNAGVGVQDGELIASYVEHPV